MMRLCLAALVLLVFVQLTSQAVIPLPAEVTAFSGSRPQRIYHLYFHSTRLNFLRLGLKQQHAIRNLGWEPPRPASSFLKDGTELVLEGNNNGEDFLFMHRLMIGRVNKILAGLVDNDYKKIEGWKTVPAPGDTDYPVPAEYVIPDQDATNTMINLFKSDDFYWDVLKPAEDQLRKKKYLKTRTLGQLGAKLENEIHFYCHNRFSEVNSVGYRIQNALKPVDIVETMWDVPEYNWLGDFYSAHVHPTFWKIHGWVENRITDWQVANKIDRIIWIGTWEGSPTDVEEELGLVSAIDETETPVPEDTSDSSSEEEVDPVALENIVSLLIKIAANK